MIPLLLPFLASSPYLNNVYGNLQPNGLDSPRFDVFIVAKYKNNVNRILINVRGINMRP